MKSVLMSIQPRWCELIAKGEKTVEVRKTKPKLNTPFRVYIYCTKAKGWFKVSRCMLNSEDELYRLPTGEIKYGNSIELMACNSDEYSRDNFLNGKVIGEFVCSGIGEILLDKLKNFEDLSNMILANKSCLDNEEIINYLGDKSKGYCWHISDLKIYDKPKSLQEFHKIGAETIDKLDDRLCAYCKTTDRGKNATYGTPNGAVYCEGAFCDEAYETYLEEEKFVLIRPPQSWCYIENIN